MFRSSSGLVYKLASRFNSSVMLDNWKERLKDKKEESKKERKYGRQQSSAHRG